MTIQDYPYLYETHLHTNQASACAWNSGYEMAEAAHHAGYSGIIVTDHNWGGNTCVDPTLDWESWVEEFCTGYYSALEYADQYTDFDVFFGYEAGFRGTEFLVYGITPQWMKRHPQLQTHRIEEHIRMVRSAGAMVIHAHPFRKASYIPDILLFPELVDGVEGINATHSNTRAGSHRRPEYDKEAIAFACAHGLPMTAGSDIHSKHLLGGGVAFKRRLTSIEDYCRAILSGEDHVLTNGEAVFDRFGKHLYDL